MRAFETVLRPVRRAAQAFDAIIKRYLLYPLRRWLTLQHFTALIMLLFALALVNARTEPSRRLAEVLHAPALPMLLALLFAAMGAFLIRRPVGEVRYRIATLPIVAYGVVLLWYKQAGYSSSWIGVVFVLAIYGLFQIARTEPPKGGAPDGHPE